MPLAAIIAPEPSLDRTLERVRLAETLGYDAVHISQVDGDDALTVLAAYALATERIGLATNVVPIYSRTPATMAQTAATLQRISNGRFTLGLGVSHAVVVEGWHGDSMGRPAPELKEYVRVLRGVLNGTPAPAGRRWRSEMSIAGIGSVEQVPIFGAALAPAMLRAVGETCDGVMLWLCNPAYIRDVVIPEIATGRERAGKTMEGFDVIADVPAAAGHDTDVAAAALRRQLAHYIQLPAYRAVVERSGFGGGMDAFDAAAASDDADGMAASVSGEFLHSLAAIGDEAGVTAALKRYRDAGVTMPAVSPIPGLDVDAALRAAAPTAK
jgi:alkanesulfonate monooxygenase SsuD/methylene tetrahydromethanopterin reductase-like flavin-dependent oxidoreductase (luciferase family)